MPRNPGSAPDDAPGAQQGRGPGRGRDLDELASGRHAGLAGRSLALDCQRCSWQHTRIAHGRCQMAESDATMSGHGTVASTQIRRVERGGRRLHGAGGDDPRERPAAARRGGPLGVPRRHRRAADARQRRRAAGGRRRRAARSDPASGTSASPARCSPRPRPTTTSRSSTANCRDIAGILQTVRLIRVASPVVRDLVAGFGEIWSTRLFTRYLQARGTRPGGVHWIDAREIVADRPGAARPEHPLAGVARERRPPDSARPERHARSSPASSRARARGCRRRSAATAATSRRRSSARCSTRRRSSSGPTSTAC